MLHRCVGVLLLGVVIALPARAEEVSIPGQVSHMADAHPEEVAANLRMLRDVCTTLASMSARTAADLHASVAELDRARADGRPMTAFEKRRLDDAVLRARQAIASCDEALRAVADMAELQQAAQGGS